MPTENEFKFVLDLDKLDAIRNRADKEYSVMQAYLSNDGSTRVRQIDDVFLFTFKKFCVGRLIEIENVIEERDFHDLWKVAKRKLRKIRYSFYGYDGWTVDLILGPDAQPYFCLAELELPEGQIPLELPDFIQQHLLYEVRQTDNPVYSNFELSNQQHAEFMYDSLVGVFK